jgi:hypothetical protein
VAQDNVETVRRFIARINAQEFDAALALLTPDAQLDWSGSDAPGRGVSTAVKDGPRGWRGALPVSATRTSTCASCSTRPERRSCSSRARADTGAPAGPVIEALGAVVCALRDGRIALTRYASREQALKAARLAQ